jgi:hypothetical protein
VTSAPTRWRIRVAPADSGPCSKVPGCEYNNSLWWEIYDSGESLLVAGQTAYALQRLSQALQLAGPAYADFAADANAFAEQQVRSAMMCNAPLPPLVTVWPRVVTAQQPAQHPPLPRYSHAPPADRLPPCAPTVSRQAGRGYGARGFQVSHHRASRATRRSRSHSSRGTCSRVCSTRR